MASTTESAVLGTRLFVDGGLTYHNADGQLALTDDPEFNGTRTPPIANTADIHTGSGNYLSIVPPVPMRIDYVCLDVITSAGTRTTSGFTADMVLEDNSVVPWTSWAPDLGASTHATPSAVMDERKVVELRLTFTTGAINFRINSAHLYASRFTPMSDLPGLWMTDHKFTTTGQVATPRDPGAPQGALPGPLSLATPRKLGQWFDSGSVGSASSTHGEFYIYNTGEKGAAIAPVLRSRSPRDWSDYPGHQHLLFSIDGLTWSSQLTLPNIPAQGYSRLIRFIDTAHPDVPLGRINVLAVCVPASWSSGQVVMKSESMCASFAKTVTTATADPDIWFVTPFSVSPGQPVTVWGQGLDNRDFAIWNRASGWELLSSAPAVVDNAHTAGRNDIASVVIGGSRVVSNISGQRTTLTMPATQNTGLVSYSVRVSSADLSVQDVFHSVRVVPPLKGDLGLPPMIMQSQINALVVPEGLAPGEQISQRKSVFTKPNAIITGLPRATPMFMVNATAAIEVINSSRTSGRISDIPSFGTLSMTRFYPSAASVVSRSDLGPTKQGWLSLDSTENLIFDTAEGTYIDPMTEFETVDPDVNIASPAMVFPSGAVAQLTRRFEDRELSTGRLISRYTMMMVVLLGPDPSPVYREVVLGEPERLSTLPAHLMKTTSPAVSAYNASLRYDKRHVQALAGRARPRTRIDGGFLGRRPIIVGLTVGRYWTGRRYIPMSRMTYVGKTIRRVPISAGTNWSALATPQIGDTVAGDTFRVLEFLTGPHLSVARENSLINRLDAIYGVMN